MKINPVRTYPKVVGFFFLIMFLAIAAILFTGFFPIAKVDSSWVLAKDLDRTMVIAERYYQAIKKAYKLNDPENPPTEEELKANVLLSLIEEKLIEQGAREELGGEFDRILSLRLAEAVKDQELLEAGQGLYGLSREEFINEVLKPGVRADILESQLFMSSTDLNEWLADRKEQAQVAIYSSDYYWDGEVVGVK